MGDAVVRESWLALSSEALRLLTSLPMDEIERRLSMDEPAVPEGREPAAVEGQPSDEEWDALVERVWDAHQTTGYQGERFMWDRDFDSAAAMLRDELARWGNQQPPRPIPVSERQPLPEEKS